MMKRNALATLTLSTVALTLGLAGCNKAEEAAPAPGYGSVNPKGEPAVAPTQAAKVMGGEGVGSQPSSAAMDGTQGLPPGHPPIDGSGAAAAVPAGGGSLSGTIELDPARTADIKAGGSLFLIVRQDNNGQDGALLASKKIPVMGADMFPMDFEISAKDVMMPGAQLAGRVRVKARVDYDGDAMTKQKGDVVGAVPDAVDVGATGVVLKLNEMYVEKP